MEQETTDVKAVATEASQVSTDESGTSKVSEDVKTQDVVDKNVYEKVKEAMKSEREAKRAEQARVRELEERLSKLESQRPEESFEDYDPYKAKTDLLFLMNKDPFIKENLDLIEEKMTDNPRLDVVSAAREIKAEFFDRIQKEIDSVKLNQPFKQEKPTATPETIKPQLSGNILKDAMDGKLEVPQGQLDAIKRVMGGLGK